MRKENHGIRKVCGCARRTWAKCPYPWHFNFTWKGTPYRFSLDRHIGRQVSERAEAEAEADKLRAAIRDGSFCAVPTPPVPPPSTPEDVTFAKLGELWLERARDGQVTSAKTDRSMIAKLSATPLEDGVTLGTRSVGRVTPDDLAVALRALKSAGRSASTRNKYLQTLKSLQKWGRRNHYLTRVWLDEDFELRRERHARRDRRLEPDVVNEKGVLIREGEELRRLDLHFHDLRHEAGSRLLECGWPIHHAQQMLGHADLKQTADYLNVTRMGLSNSMRRFGTAAAMQTDANATATEHPPTGTAALPPAPQVTIN